MLHKKMQTIRIGIEGIESVPSNEIYERVMRGEVIVIRQFLQLIDYFEKFQEVSLEGISQVVGPEKALQVKEKGFEAIHEIIDIDELYIC